MNAWDGFAFNRLRHAQRGTGEATAKGSRMRQLAIIFPPPMTEHERIAAAKLARIVETTRNSFEREQYRRHRQAALKGLGRG
jgi:hypothetical protein